MKFTSEQIEYIQTWYGKKTSQEIADYIGCDAKRIVYKAKKLGLKSSLSRRPKQTLERLIDSEVKMVGEYKGSRIKVDFVCPFCKKIFQTTPDRVAYKHTQSCGCAKIGVRKGLMYISSTYFNRVKRNAKHRGIEFVLTIEYVENLLIEQNFRCSLTGRKIVAGYINDKKNPKSHTASLDRIDNKIGYVVGNVQWVHKDINRAKQYFDQQYFIELCKEVTQWNSQ